jgi:hypothetical protein
MVKITKRDLAIIGGAAGVADFLLEGRLSAPLSRALKKSAVAVGSRALMTAPAAARVTAATLPRIGGTALRVGKTIALRHPVLTAGAVAYYTIKNRDEIEDIIREGYEVVQESGIGSSVDPGRFVPAIQSEFDRLITEGPRPSPGRLPPNFLKKPVRRKTKFNKAVSAGMKTVKASTSYGKKGTINNAKKAFTAVTKTASRINKGAKVAKSGITRKIGLAVKRILK